MIEQESLLFSKKDIDILRSLAHKLVELINDSEEEKKKTLWLEHNKLQKTRPLIFCDPENGWNEIILPSDIKSENILARRWEFELRKEIFRAEKMKDDKVIEPALEISYFWIDSGWGMKEKKVGGENGGSYKWEAPLSDYAEITKLHFPRIEVDHNKTIQVYNVAKEIFTDILEIKLKGKWWWSLGLASTLARLRGLETIMYDMYDFPECLHKLMNFIKDGYLDMLDFLERNSLLSLNNDGTYVGSGGFGWTDELPSKNYDGLHVRTIDMWGFAESQETSQISPQMFEEFIFQYQIPILERFGLNCYGCCEPLDKIWEVIKKIPKLRRVSVSPWANIKFMAEKLQDKYIFSWKPNPSYLAYPQIDEDIIRKQIRKALKDTNNCVVEVILKDTHTIGKNPFNIIKWCEIAKQESYAI